MAVLIDQTGKVFLNIDNINKSLFPVQVGNFEISNEARRFIENEIDEFNVHQLFQFVPNEIQTICQNKKLIPTKASIFKSQTQEPQTRSQASQRPHINSGDELHLFFAGSHIIYFNINDQHFSVIVQSGDSMFIPNGVEHWIKETEDHYLIIVSYHCEPFEIFHSKVKYTNTESHAFL